MPAFTPPLPDEIEGFVPPSPDDVEIPIGAGRQAFSRFARAALGGVAGTLEAIPIAATALASKFGDPLLSETEERDVTSRPLYRAGQAIRRAAENAYPVDQNRPKSFLVDTLPQTAGSMAAFMAGGAAGKVAGASTAATVAALGAGVSGADAFDEAKKAGANDEDAFKVFAINAGLGTTEAVPIAGWLNRLNKASGNKLKRAIIEGSEEAAQEVFQQVGGNLTAQKYYDPDRKLFEGAGEGGAAGFTLGSLMSLVVSAIGGRRARVPETQIQTVTDDLGLSRFAPVKEDPNVTDRESSSMEVPTGQPAQSVPPVAAGTSSEIQKPAAVLAQAQPIEPEVARQKLWVNMQGREMDVPLDQWQQPASPHLKLVLGDNAPSWRDLNFLGVVTANKNPGGSYRVKVIPRTTEQTLPVPTETGIADELNQLRAIANPTAEQQTRIAQIEAQDQGKAQRAAWEAQMKAGLEARKAASANAPKPPELMTRKELGISDNWKEGRAIVGEAINKKAPAINADLAEGPLYTKSNGWISPVLTNAGYVLEDDFFVLQKSVVNALKDTGAAAVPQTDVSGEQTAAVKPDTAEPRKRRNFTEMEDEDLMSLYHRYRYDYSRRPTEALDRRIELVGDELAYRSGLTEGVKWGNRGEDVQQFSRATPTATVTTPEAKPPGVKESLTTEPSVLTDNGKPLIVYRGGSKTRTENEHEIGTHFGSLDQAKVFQSQAAQKVGWGNSEIKAVHLTLKKPFVYLGPDKFGQTGYAATVAHMMEAQLAGKPPESFRTGDYWGRLPEGASDKEIYDFLKNKLKERGYDSIQYTNTQEGPATGDRRAWIIFDNSAIVPLRAKDAQTPTPATPVAETSGEMKRGEVGGMLASGEVVLTSSGRKTTPFPVVKADTNRKTTATVKRVDAWLRDNAIAEAQARGDEFNLRQFTAENPAKMPKASKDSMEEYLFGQQPDVPRPFLKPVATTPAAAPAQKTTAPASDVSPKQSANITIDAALALAQRRKVEGKSQLSVARELSESGLSDGDATGVAGQVFAAKPAEIPASDLFPDLKGKAPTLERVRNAIVEAEADLETKFEAASDENIRSDNPIHAEVDLAQKRVDRLRELGQRLEKESVTAAKAEAAPEANIAERAIEGGEGGSQIPFRDLGPGHATFDDGVRLLIDARSLTEERAEILRDVFRDTNDAYLGRFTIDARTMRAVGWARWTGAEGDNRKAWLKLKRGLADLTDTAREGFWAEPSHEPIVVFAHEYAHVSEYLLLTDADRALVKEVFQKLKADGRIIDFFREGMSTTDASAKYYAKNWKEFLSESFAEYVMSKKVPLESMRPILARLYDAFKAAIGRVFLRGAKGETAMLEPLYEKMLSGGEISREGPTGKAMASGGAPEPTGEARAREEEVRGSVIDPATGKWVEAAEGGNEEVQVNSITFEVRGVDRMTPEEKEAGVARAQDYFTQLGLPGTPDFSKGTQRGSIDTNAVFTIKADGQLHDDIGERILQHLTSEIQQLHQPTGSPGYVAALVNAITKNYSFGNLKGVFSKEMTDRLLPVPVQVRSFAGSFLRALTGIPLTMANVARNADWHLRRLYEDMFGGDLVRKLMDRIALNFRERFTGEEIERLYNENPILQELFLKVVSRLKVKPSLRDVIQEIFNTRIDRQDGIVEKFVNTMVNKFSATPSEAERLKAEFSRTFEASFRAAREKAQAKALAALTPEERKVVGAQTPLWRKLTDLVNSGWFDSTKAVEEYARSKGMKVPTEAELKQMRNWSIKEQSLREPTASEIEKHGEAVARSNAEGATLESRQDLLRKMNTQWSRWTHPLASLRHPSSLLDPVRRYNSAMAANEWLTANLLLKLGFGSRQIIDVGTQMVLHTPTRAAQYAFEQWSNDRSAGRDASLVDALSTSITDAYRTRLKVLGDTLASFKRTLVGRGEQKNVEQLISSIAVFDRALLKADEMKAQGRPAAARFLQLLALTLRFGRQFAAAADVIQGVPAEAQEMAHQIRTGLREQGKPKFQQDFEFNTILGLLTTARAESLSEARQILEARGLETSNSAVQRAAWHILREKIYSMAKNAGLPADEWKAQNHYYRNVIGWNEPETQGLGAIGGPGGAVALTAKIGKELFSRAGIPAFPFVFGNAMGVSLNRKLAYTPLGLFPGFFKGSPWFEGERNIRQRKIEAVVGTTTGSILFTLAALGIWVVLPRKWPDDEKEKAKWTANGWQPGMLIVPVSDTQEMKIGTRVGPMSLLSPYLAAGGAFHDATTQRAKKQEELNERAAKLGLTPEKLEGLDAGQWLNVIGSAAYASAVGGRTASGMLGSYTDFGTFSAKKSGASATSTLVPGLPGFQEISRMAGANINPKLASFWDLLVPLPTSDANRVNLLGDPMRNENDVERIFQILSGGTAPLPANSDQFKKNKAYTNLFASDFRPPSINPVRGYQFGNELRPMSEPELQRYAVARGRNFAAELAGVDVAGLPPKEAKAVVQGAFQRANVAALNEVGASSPKAAGASAERAGAASLPVAAIGSIAPRRTGLARLAASRVGGGSRIARPRFASLRGLGRPTRRRRSIVGRLGRVRRPRGLSMRGLRRPRMPRPRRLRRRLTLV